MKKNILIVGLGLIGGSIAAGLPKEKYNIYGIDIDKDTVNYAIDNLFINNPIATDTELISCSDIIIICLYPKDISAWIENNQKYFKPKCLISDVSGVKNTLYKQIQKFIRKDVEYLSIHPMAGKETSGIRNCDFRMFQNANMILCVNEENSIKAIDCLIAISNELGFKNIKMLTSKKHDEIVGYLSGLTHLIAVALMNSKESDNFIEYTGDSFKDLTRIGKINDKLWSELFLLNSEVLIKEIDIFVFELLKLKSAIIHDNDADLRMLLKKSSNRRKKFDSQ